MIALTL